MFASLCNFESFSMVSPIFRQTLKYNMLLVICTYLTYILVISLSLSLFMYIYIYIHTDNYTCIYIYLYPTGSAQALLLVPVASCPVVISMTCTEVLAPVGLVGTILCFAIFLLHIGFLWFQHRSLGLHFRRSQDFCLVIDVIITFFSCSKELE